MVIKDAFKSDFFAFDATILLWYNPTFDKSYDKM